MKSFQATQFWEERYGQQEYAYGTEPNTFLAEVLPQVESGAILFPAEGEGRNAVFAASLGWQVDAFDFSAEGRRKALALAESKGVSIRYILADLMTFTTEVRYQAIALIFVHLPPDARLNMLRQCIELLEPGGALIIEGFHPLQIGKPSGGPNDASYCYTQTELESLLESGFNIIQLTDQAVTLTEGPHHTGPAHTLRLLATKK